MHERVLDIEVVLVVEDGDEILLARWLLGPVVAVCAFGGNWDRGQVNLLRICGGLRFCHGCDVVWRLQGEQWGW